MTLIKHKESLDNLITEIYNFQYVHNGEFYTVKP